MNALKLINIRLYLKWVINSNSMGRAFQLIMKILILRLLKIIGAFIMSQAGVALKGKSHKKFNQNYERFGKLQ